MNRIFCKVFGILAIFLAITACGNEERPTTKPDVPIKSTYLPVITPECEEGVPLFPEISSPYVVLTIHGVMPGSYWLEITVTSKWLFGATEERFLISAGSGGGEFTNIHKGYIRSIRGDSPYSNDNLVLSPEKDYTLKGYLYEYTEGMPDLNENNMLFAVDFSVPSCQ